MQSQKEFVPIKDPDLVTKFLLHVPIIENLTPKKPNQMNQTSLNSLENFVQTEGGPSRIAEELQELIEFTSILMMLCSEDNETRSHSAGHLDLKLHNNTWWAHCLSDLLFCAPDGSIDTGKLTEFIEETSAKTLALSLSGLTLDINHLLSLAMIGESSMQKLGEYISPSHYESMGLARRFGNFFSSIN